jgi:5-methylcytosine-specific restriction endonuclease McrA
VRKRIDYSERKTCEQCGKEFGPRRDRSWSAKQWANARFCGPSCGNTWKALNSEGAGAAFKGGPEHGQKVRVGQAPHRQAQATKRRAKRRHEAATKRLALAAKGASGVGRWYGATCRGCSTSFVSRWPAQTCSKRCRRRVDNRLRRDAYGNHRERARFYGVAYEPVQRQTIFTRDGYRCQLCGLRTRGKWPNPRSPTLDHIVPLVLGGAHTPTNLQCACAACNSLKGERAANEQLRLA